MLLIIHMHNALSNKHTFQLHCNIESMHQFIHIQLKQSHVHLRPTNEYMVIAKIWWDGNLEKISF